MLSRFGIDTFYPLKHMFYSFRCHFPPAATPRSFTFLLDLSLVFWWSGFGAQRQPTQSQNKSNNYYRNP
jgi:hypothetical protein